MNEVNYNTKQEWLGSLDCKQRRLRSNYSSMYAFYSKSIKYCCNFKKDIHPESVMNSEGNIKIDHLKKFIKSNDLHLCSIRKIINESNIEYIYDILENDFEKVKEHIKERSR